MKQISNPLEHLTRSSGFQTSEASLHRVALIFFFPVHVRHFPHQSINWISNIFILLSPAQTAAFICFSGFMLPGTISSQDTSRVFPHFCQNYLISLTHTHNLPKERTKAAECTYTSFSGFCTVWVKNRIYVDNFYTIDIIVLFKENEYRTAKIVPSKNSF